MVSRRVVVDFMPPAAPQISRRLIGTALDPGDRLDEILRYPGGTYFLRADVVQLQHLEILRRSNGGPKAVRTRMTASKAQGYPRGRVVPAGSYGGLDAHSWRT